MMTSKQVKPTISSYVVGRTKSVLLKALVLVGILGAVASAGATAFHYSSLVDNTVATYRASLAQSLVYGDSFQTRQQSASIVKGNVFSTAWVVTPALDRIIGQSGDGDASFEDLKHSFHDSRFAVKLNHGRLELFGKYPLWDAQRETLGYLIIGFPLPLAAMLLLWLAFASAFSIVAGMLSYSTRRVALEVSAPVTAFADYIATFELTAKRDDDMQASLPYLELSDLFGKFHGMIARLAEAEKREAELSKSAAIARTTTMLAHDIRKPFSMLKMGLAMLGRAVDPAGVKNVLGKVVPEIDRAMSHVNGMLEDLLEVGSTSTQLIQEPVNPETLIEQTLGEIFRVYPKADVAVTYRLNHTHAVHIHAQKVGRVFSNIVGNAVQAMNLKGWIWFATREISEHGKAFVEFTVGNAGPVIPTENLNKLFEAFFTRGKKGGTGLGLAIAQKVVTAHGGRIWCESSTTADHPEGQVEFKFTLPVSAAWPVKTVTKLPVHSYEVIRELLEPVGDQGSPTSQDPSEMALESDIRAFAKAKGRPLKVLVVDDEAIYRSALASSLGRTPELTSAITVLEAQDGDEGLAKLSTNPDLIVTDVDMGHQTDGFDFVEAARQAGFTGLICIHSNRMVAKDHRAAFEKGADAFIPKPMARAQLLKLVLQAAQESQLIVHQLPATISTAKPEILVVEDNPFILEVWQQTLQDEATVYGITSFEALNERLESDPGFATRLLLAITDMHLDGSAGDGLAVGRLLKKHRPELRVLLSSDGVISPHELIGAIDVTIGKNPVGLAALSRF